MTSAARKSHDSEPLLRSNPGHASARRVRSLSGGSNTPGDHAATPSTQVSVRNALARVFGVLFRSNSDPSIRPPSPPRRHGQRQRRSSSASPCTEATEKQRTAATGAHRRRFQRVVRNENARPPDQPDDNPFVVRKFDQEYLTKYYAENQKVQKLVHNDSTCSHPILKKSPGSGDRLASIALTSSEPTGHSPMAGPTLPTGPATSPAGDRHAKFRDVVQIVEFRLRDRVQTSLHVTHEERLYDDDDETHNDHVTPAAADAEATDGPFKNIFSSVHGHDNATPATPAEAPLTKHIRLVQDQTTTLDAT